ncbi:hypothetical protein SB581_12185 [Acinetobacter baumannii]|nr:hypothetical protein SB581_12185 [Acinetobacter baumannii]
MSQSDDRRAIERLGGATKVAGLLGFKVQRVQNWMDRGIPPKIKLEYPHLFLNPNIRSKTVAA